MPVFIKYLLLTSLLSFLMAIFPSLIILMAILWGGSLIMAGIYLDLKKLLAVTLLSIAILYAVAGVHIPFYHLAFFGLSAIVMSLLANIGKEYYHLQKWGVAAAIIGVTLFTLMIYFSTGQIGTQEMEKQLNIYLQENKQQFEQSGLIELYEERGISREQLEDSMQHMVKSFARHLPAFYYLQAILAAFFMLFLAAILCHKAGLERLKKRPFKYEIMPWQLAWVVIAGLALWLLGRAQMNSLYYIGSNILVIMLPISVYFGLAAVAFKLKEQKPVHQKWITIILIILSVLFLPSAIVFFSVIGVFDALLDYRKLRLEKEDGI
ncbi:MAG: DUF2232 domain-containing protein [Syntrophomonadaceae bacterium]|nr:DUF2232 domain-containing protein [Syntrophomonadaceae bacterium]MDD3271527.1 DUF2232 domain-containing protein [Syntrophomonadaceae bacterium]MDD3898909.1 DUF2232 domain-containing protein [Syntrophomonadaceae bacterium]MDD4562631.1 DUF2232 domain-containing protein [Syntrophomonadaceae bacterium]